MASCEKCWGEAARMERDGLGNQVEIYHELLQERVCTPKEQAGQFWDEEKNIDKRLLTGGADGGQK